MSMTTAPTPKPTQVKRPWRATVRSIFQFAIGLASLLPLIATGVYTDLDQAPVVVGQVLAVSAAITRIMAIPQVEAFLREHGLVSWLAAERPILGKSVMSPRDPR